MSTVATNAQLAEEVQALRETVARLAGERARRHLVTLRPVVARALLGQAVTMVARVTDTSGLTPRIDAPVTFVATWGRLSAADGYSIQHGQSVTVRTGVDGAVSVTLKPPTSEDVSPTQQDALDTALASLDEDAPTPRHTEAALTAMARQYRGGADLDFRRAVDIFFRDFRHRVVDTVNPRPAMSAWSYLDCTVTAYACSPEGDEAGFVGGAAVLTLRFKDWLGPWLAVLENLAESESTLGRDLEEVKEAGGQSGNLLEGLNDRLQDYLDRQQGLAGEYMGQRVGKSTIFKFLETGEDLPLEVKGALPLGEGRFNAAVLAARSGLYADVEQARGALKDTLDAFKGEVAAERGAALGGFKGEVAAERGAALTGLKGEIAAERGAALTGLKGEVAAERGAAVTGFKGEIAAERGAALGGFKGEVTAERGAALTGLKADVAAERGAALTGFKGEVAAERGAAVTGFKGEIVTERGAALTGFKGEIAAERGSALTGLKGEIAAERGAALTGLKGEIAAERGAALTGFKGEIAAERGAALTGLKGEVAAERGTALAGFKTAAAAERSAALAGFKTNLGNEAQASLDGFKLNLGSEATKSLSSFTAGLAGQSRLSVASFRNSLVRESSTSLDSFRSGLTAATGGLESRVVELEKSVTSVGNNVLSLRTDFLSRPR